MAASRQIATARIAALVGSPLECSWQAGATGVVARRAPLYRCLMFSSWRGWRLPHVRWVYGGAYVVGALLALLLGAGVWSVLIAVAVGAAVVGPLELWYRQRHPASPAGP